MRNSTNKVLLQVGPAIATGTLFNTTIDTSEFETNLEWSSEEELSKGHGLWRLGALGTWLLALSTLTAPVVFVDLQRELLRSGSSSLFYPIRRRKGQLISIAEARQLALRISDETERRLQRERATEAFFLLASWEEVERPTDA
jgi:hypothetical protein